jgi:hypothetical protein
MRTFVVDKDTDLQTLSARLLDQRTRKGQGGAALERLRLLNPHADPKKLTAGTVLFLPDVPGFKASAGVSETEAPRTEFEALVEAALKRAGERAAAGFAVREAERAAVSKALGSTAFKNATRTDERLKPQGEAAAAAMEQEAVDDKEARRALATVSEAALAALARLRKLG